MYLLSTAAHLASPGLFWPGLSCWCYSRIPEFLILFIRCWCVVGGASVTARPGIRRHALFAARLRLQSQLLMDEVVCYESGSGAPLLPHPCGARAQREPGALSRF